MRIAGVIWLEGIVDKLAWKHNVTTEEVEETLELAFQFHHIEHGNYEDEDLYAAFGQSAAGRYLTVFFIYKKTHDALIISARDMTKPERRTHGRRK